MSFDDHSGSTLTEPVKIENCKPDYEVQAANLKRLLDSTLKLEKALFDFSNINGVYEFRKISSFAEMIGGVVLIKNKQASRYEELLKNIEKNS